MRALKVIKVFAFISIVLFGLLACEEDDDRPTPPSDYPRTLEEIIANPSKIKEMQFYLPIRLTNGVNFDFLTFIVDHRCKYDNTISTNIEKTYANYEYTLNAGTVKYKSLVSSDSSTFVDPKSVIITTDNITDSSPNLSIFFIADGVVDGIRYNSLRVFSGTLSPNRDGFTNTYDCFVMLYTDPDPDDKVADVGTIRVFKSP